MQSRCPVLLCPLAQNVLESLPTDGKVQAAVKEILNPALGEISLPDIRVNADSKKAYPLSLDGTAVERLIGDLKRGIDDAAQESSLLASNSVFLRAVARLHEKLQWPLDSVLAAMPMIQHWTLGMELAFKMKPLPQDYDLAKQHLALFVVCKLRWKPNSLSWYDNECLYTLGRLHKKWGSLRLVSQEGMEAWQARLNEVLRQSNGYANAGAIPMEVKQRGQAAVLEYMEKRRAQMPSSAQWIYEQAALQLHAYHADVHAARDALKQRGAVITHPMFVVYWSRYMVAAALRCKLRARRQRGQLKAQRARGAAPPAGADYYKRLLAEHNAYYADVQLTAADLADEEKRRQQSIARRERYAARRATADV